MNLPTWAALWLATLVAFTLFADLSQPTGWLGSDDAAYHAAAEHLLTGTTIQRVHHHYSRMAIIVPVALSMRLFGDNEWAVALPSVVAAIGCVIVVAWIGAITWSWWEGLCAATFVASIPYFRVLSTTGYPDVHACFWASLAVLAALQCRASDANRRLLYAVFSGLAAAIAVSAKVTCVAVVPIVVWMVCAKKPPQPSARWRSAAALGCGMIIAFWIEGLFHWAVAGDFWFSLRSLRNTQGATELFAASELRRSAGFLAFVVDRLTLPLRPADSGWGILGGAFWPVLIGALWIDARSRIFAAWGLLAYLSVAFLPVSGADGLQPMPIFHGRHVLTAILPFALCLGRLAHRLASRLAPDRLLAYAWPGVILTAGGLLFATRRDLNGFQDRDTRRIGQAITQLVESGALDGTHDILMTPSMYWRYRILFPVDMRTRLQIAVQDGAPDWWTQTAPGIADRRRPLPTPDQATLLATPKQLRGEPEHWDYGCPLPRERLEDWRTSGPLHAVIRGADRTRTIVTATDASRDGAILVAVGGRNVP